MNTNPLLNLGFEIPFDRIEAAHVEPASEALIERAQAQLDEIAALTGDAAGSRTPPMIGPGSVDWVGLGRQAHAAAGHAQLLGFVEIARLLNAMEAAGKRADLTQLEAARDGLSAQLALGGPAAPEP